VLALSVAAALAGTDRFGSPAAADPVAPDVAWLQRSYGLTPGEAKRRLAAEDAHGDTAKLLLRTLGEDAAGAWLEPETGALVVNVIDMAALPAIRAANARPRLVTRSADDLGAVKRRLDAYAAVRDAGRAVSWYVDVPANAVAVDLAEDTGDDGRATRAFLALARSFGEAVRVRQGRGTTTTQDGLSGGHEIDTADSQMCSVGFNARDSAGHPFLITAGHCGRSTPSFTRNGRPVGQVRAARFPVDDFAVVSLDNIVEWEPRPTIERYGAPPLGVRGHSRALVGSTVCKSGRTTKWTCGRVVAHDVTVRYDNGATVYGLTQASTCSRSGDSGGPLMAGGFAQGMVSGGRGIQDQCLERYGGQNVSFFQPVGEALKRYGLRLLTSP
jgi:streptogrisin C